MARRGSIQFFKGPPQKSLRLAGMGKGWWSQNLWWMVGLALVLLASVGGGVALVMTYTDKKSFVKMMDAILASLGLAPETRLIVLAHAGVETALGTAGTAPQGNNFWNISAGSQWAGPVVLGGDQEPDGSGGWKNIVQRWRSYVNPLEGAKDYLKFLSRSTPVSSKYATSYAEAWARALEGDVAGFVYTLRDAGYFTADPAKYLAMMNGQIGLVQKLLSEA